jgi:beta-glucosidase
VNIHSLPIDRRATLAALVIVCSVVSATRTGVTESQRDSAIDSVVAQMTLDEKIAMLHGAQDPERYGQAGYLPGVPRLGIPPLRLTDGPAGIRTSQPATALPAPVALAATFSPELAHAYGRVLANDARARQQNVVLGPMVNIVRAPQAGRNFETLGEDPLLASRIVADEIRGMTEMPPVIATVKHFALNNQENQRQSVSADVDERTMREIELPAFESAVKAGAQSVMASYNKVNGTWAAENSLLLTDILRKEWGFTGFVVSDWGAAHSGAAALAAGLDLEMPSGRYFATLADAVHAGQLSESAIDQAVKRILTAIDKSGLLARQEHAPVREIPATSRDARDIAIAGAVLLKNDGHLLPLGGDASIAIIGPTAQSLLVGGGGSAHVTPMHTGSVIEALRTRMTSGTLAYALGYDVQGTAVPASALAIKRTTGAEAVAESTIDFTGPKALPAGTSWTWTGTITAPVTGDYTLALQTTGGRGTFSVDPPAPSPGAPVPSPPAGGRGGGGRGGRGGPSAGLLPTTDGLSNAKSSVHFDAGIARTISVSANADVTTPMQVRLAWLTPSSSDDAIAEAVRVAKTAKTAVVFAYDEGQEGRDRTSLSLLGAQDALIAAVAAANPRTIVVLNNGAPVLMPWVDKVPAILQMWYPGQEGADATAALLRGEAAPGGKLPVTFPVRAEDAPTSASERYPGVDGHSQYSEGIFVGYRWYDHEKIAPLFPFGHGLSYADFEYSNLKVAPGRDGSGYDVTFTIRNAGTRVGIDVPQVYVGPPASAPVPMADRQLAGFERISLGPGQSRSVSIHISARELSYWSVADHRWVIAAGVRTVMVGASSRDVRLKADLTVK